MIVAAGKFVKLIRYAIARHKARGRATS